MGEEKPEEKKDEKSTPTNKKKKVEKNTGLTISSAPGTNTGATISTYDKDKDGKDIKDKSNIYEDPNTGSTIATKEARTNIAQGGGYQIKASTSTPLKPYDPASMASYVPVGKVLYEKPTKPPQLDSSDRSKDFNIVQKQKKLISEPRPSEDLLTGDPLKSVSYTHLTMPTKAKE